MLRRSLVVVAVLFTFAYQPNPVDDSRMRAELIEQASRKLAATQEAQGSSPVRDADCY